MGKKYLLDSNAVIDYLAGRFSLSEEAFVIKIVNNAPNVSIITKIEVLGFDTPANSYQILVDFFNDAIVLGLAEDVVNTTIAIRKKHKIKLPDAIIAATALVYNLVLITRNINDFKNIAGLVVENAHNK